MRSNAERWNEKKISPCIEMMQGLFVTTWTKWRKGKRFIRITPLFSRSKVEEQGLVRTFLINETFDAIRYLTAPYEF